MQIQSVNLQTKADYDFAFANNYARAAKGVSLRDTKIPPIPDIYKTVWQSKKPYQIWYGGRGGAKSWTKAIQFLERAEEQEYFRLIFARDTQKNVRGSQYQLFKDICGKFECFKDRFDFLSTTMTITSRKTGNFMQGGSFEMPDTLRSTADPTDFWAEEPITREAQIDRDSFLDIVGSLRNSYGQQTQFHFTFNPISKETWIYEDFFEKNLYDCEKLFVNYFDNPFCPQTTIDFLNSLKTIDPKRYEVDALGNWGVRREGLILPEFESVEKEEMPPTQFYGLDFGYTHQTALVAEAVEDVPGKRQSLFVEELIYETRLQSYSLIAEMNRLGISKKLKIICDNARPEQIQDLRDAGFNAEPCKKYSGSVQDGINRVLGFDLKIVKGSRNYFDEIKNWVWDMKNGKIIDVPKKSVDHLMFATLYGSEFLNQPVFVFTEEDKQIIRLLK